MGLLTGKFSADAQRPDNDMRSNDMDWSYYLKGGRPSPTLLAIGELLCSNGCSLGQGCWRGCRPRTH